MKSSLGRIPDDLAAKIEDLAGIKPPPPVIETVSEKDFQQAVFSLFAENGWRCFHVNIPKRSKEGWPDGHFLRHRCVVAELKVGDGEPTAAQSAYLEAFQAAGIDAYLWFPTDWPAIVAIATETPNAGPRSKP